MQLWQLYLLTRLDSFSDITMIFGLICTISLFLLILMHICSSCSEQGDYNYKDNMAIKKGVTPYLKALIIIAPLLLLFHVLTPTKKDAFLIVGGYYLTNNQEVMQLPTNVALAANAFLKDYSNELKDDVTKSIGKEDGKTHKKE